MQIKRTAKLWLLYIKCIQTVKMFLFAERTGNWTLHLEAVSKMLNIFAATGHGNYAKCAYYYLQKMQELPDTHPWLHQQFIDGQHAVQRYDKNWTSVWTDLIIEQTLMRAIKYVVG